MWNGLNVRYGVDGLINLFASKKGLISGLIAFLAVLFLMGIISIIATQMWTQTNEVFQNLDNNTASQHIKDQIDAQGQIMYMGDYFFVYTFVALLIGYLITASVSNTSNPVFVIIFLAILIIVVLVAMILSNAWTYMLSQDFITEQDNYKLTDFVLTNFPIIAFFIGVLGIIIFYSRRREAPDVAGGEF